MHADKITIIRADSTITYLIIVIITKDIKRAEVIKIIVFLYSSINTTIFYKIIDKIIETVQKTTTLFSIFHFSP